MTSPPLIATQGCRALSGLLWKCWWKQEGGGGPASLAGLRAHQ